MSMNAPDRTGRDRGPSPWVAERVRPLTRRQVMDRLPELGDLYAENSGGGSWEWNQGRGLFLHRLVLDVRQPGFALLIAETTTVTGCAYGFPVRDYGTWWQGLDGYLPGALLRLGAAGRLFAVSGIVVQPRVRTTHQSRDWNLARRLQKRLLTDHDATLGVMLVDRGEVETLAALQAWGWRYVPVDTAEILLPAPCRVLVLGT